VLGGFGIKSWPLWPPGGGVPTGVATGAVLASQGIGLGPIYTTTPQLSGSLTISPSLTGVDPAASFGINLNTGIPISSGESPAINYVGAAATIFRIQFDTFGQQSSMIFRRADGTPGSPTALLAGEIIYNQTARGYRGDRYTTGSEGSAAWDFSAAENWSPTATGGLIAFRTCTVGQAGAASSLYRLVVMSGVIIDSQTAPLAFPADLGVGWLRILNGTMVPQLVGGAGVASTLTLQSTQGVGTSDAIIFQVGNNGATPAGRFVTGGQYVKGSTVSINAQAAATPTMQLHGTNSNDCALGGTRWSADTGAAQWFLGKSRGAAVGTRGAVLSGDNIASLFFSGDDGTNFITSGRLSCTVDGTVSTGIVPGRVAIFVASASGGTMEVFRCNSALRCRFANAASFSANGTVATALGSLGPTGANTTVQEWLTIEDVAGTVRYIPCF